MNTQQSVLVPWKSKDMRQPLPTEKSTTQSVTANVVLLPRIKRQSVSNSIPAIPATNAVIRNARDPVHGHEERPVLQYSETRTSLSKYHPSQGAQATPAYLMRKRTSSKESAIITENEEWPKDPLQYYGNLQCSCLCAHAVNKLEYRRHDSVCSSCGGSITAPSMSLGSMRRCSAVEVEMPEERFGLKGSLHQLKDPYSTFEPQDDGHGLCKPKPETKKKEFSQLKQLRRERNLLRDLLKIMYERELIAEDVRPYCKRALELCGQKP